MNRVKELERLLFQYKGLGINQQIDYNKFYLYSIITHSTAIEGSTITEIENQLLFDQGISAGGRTLIEQYMNLDLKAAYERSIELAHHHSPITTDILKELSSITMKNTGQIYHTALGDFSSANGDIRLVNVSAGIGGKSYMSFNKVPQKLKDLCDRLNSQRKEVWKKTIIDQYLLSFDAHYDLVTIHPWADGNGRMSRLLMNLIQFEYGLVPAKILKEDKERYIEALIKTRENDDKSIFQRFMLDVMIKNLTMDIKAFIDSTGAKAPSSVGKETSREKIIRLLGENGNMTTQTLSETLGITTKAIEKHLSHLKSEGIITRVGPDKGGHWEVMPGDENNYVMHGALSD